MAPFRKGCTFPAYTMGTQVRTTNMEAWKYANANPLIMA